MNEDDFREYWSRQTDSNHPARPGIDVFAIGAGEIQAFLGDGEKSRVLEIGCGAGELFQHLRLDRAAYLGVDFSDSSLREFSARHPGVRVVRGEAATFSIPEQFDFVLVNNVLQYCRPLTTMSCLLSLRAMLAPGGRIFLGNVPDRAQRVAYLRGHFNPERRAALARLARFFRSWLAVLGSDTDRIGFWYTPGEIARMAGQAGFDCAIFGCLLYPYRFSALLSHGKITVMSDRWEYGSHFHRLEEGELAAVLGEGIGALHPGATLWGSGRAALLGALEAGRARGWNRVWLPSYLCHEVASALRSARWPVSVYADDPFTRPAGLPSRSGPGCVLLRVNTFGWRGVEESERALGWEGAVIEDHTHDPTGPWARASRATLAFASLRKTYPTADGAVVWSPSGGTAPAPAGSTDEHAVAAELLHRGMIAKRLYLRGASTEKGEHRRYFAAGDARIGQGPPSAPHPDSLGLLETLSPVALGAVRRRNLERIVAAPGFPREWLAAGTVPEGGSPFALVLDLGSRARRDRILAELVWRRVFPTILWPIARGGDPASRAVAARTLTLPCDLRYTEDDLDAVGSVLALAFAREKARETGWLAAARALVDRLRG